LLVSFVKLTRVDRGFDSRNVFSFRVALPPRVQTPLAQYALHDRLLASLQALPGVRSVGAVERTLGATSIAYGAVTAGPERTQIAVEFQAITPGVFDALRIPLRGRDFRPADRSETAHTAIVNETFARRLFPGRDAIGQQIGFSSWPALDIIGVVADIRPQQLDRDVMPAVFLPVETSRTFVAPSYFIRTDRPEPLLAAIRATAAQLDSSLVMFDATPLPDLVARQGTTPKFYGLTAMGFAAVAVLLAALGLYGVLSYSVSARTREFGIRIAIGATPGRVIAGVMRQAILTVLVGVAIGLAGAVWSSRFLEALLFGVKPHNPALLAAVASVFLAVALLAAYVPARRATRVDPIAALRAE
jgi:putative ABC transport system permease protein